MDRDRYLSTDPFSGGRSATASNTISPKTAELLSSFQSVPTRGQHLLLVPRQSANAIKLEQDVAYRLRQ